MKANVAIRVASRRSGVSGGAMSASKTARLKALQRRAHQIEQRLVRRIRHPHRRQVFWPP
jgi:hypothetical protein